MDEEVNLLFGTKAKEIGKLSVIFVGIKSMAEGIFFDRLFFHFNLFEPLKGLEPLTRSLRMNCSTS